MEAIALMIDALSLNQARRTLATKFTIAPVARLHPATQSSACGDHQRLFLKVSSLEASDLVTPTQKF